MGSVDAQPQPNARRVLVVGTDNTIGLEVSLSLADSGWLVSSLPAGVARTQAAGVIDIGAVLAELGGLDALVIASWGTTIAAPKAVEQVTDADLEDGWEGSMQTMIWTLQTSFPALVQSSGSVVVLFPTTAMSGGRKYSLAAATFEAQRILMKATARQWGPSGVRLNGVAIFPESILDDVEVADVHYLAPAALGEDPTEGKRADDVIRTIQFLLTDGSSGLTGQTIGVDGGRWLMP